MSYVADAAYFMVVAGAWTHADTKQVRDRSLSHSPALSLTPAQTSTHHSLPDRSTYDTHAHLSHLSPLQVRDFRGWGGRGWCRVEQVSNALGPTPKPVIAVQSIHSIVTYGPAGVLGHSWLHNVVGLGAFTVDADRIALGPVLDRLINARMASALESGDLVIYRVLHCA